MIRTIPHGHLCVLKRVRVSAVEMWRFSLFALDAFRDWTFFSDASMCSFVFAVLEVAVGFLRVFGFGVAGSSHRLID